MGHFGNFGHYGYIKSHPITVRGYYAKVCSVAACGGKALYHCGGDGYCKQHRNLAIERRSTAQGYFEQESAAFEAKQRAIDTQLKRTEHLHRAKQEFK